MLCGVGRRHGILRCHGFMRCWQRRRRCARKELQLCSSLQICQGSARIVVSKLLIPVNSLARERLARGGRLQWSSWQSACVWTEIRKRHDGCEWDHSCVFQETVEAASLTNDLQFMRCLKLSFRVLWLAHVSPEELEAASPRLLLAPPRCTAAAEVWSHKHQDCVSQ
eukprot:650452-Amphidinium_carterae.2